MRLMYSEQVICILTTRGGSVSSAGFFYWTRFFFHVGFLFVLHSGLVAPGLMQRGSSEALGLR